MDTLLRLLNRPVVVQPAGPRARRVLWILLAGWVALHIADWATVALVGAGFREGNPLQAALLARRGLVALAVYKVVVIAAGVVATLLGLRLWPRFFIAAMAIGLLLVAAAVANNVFWLLRR